MKKIIAILCFISNGVVAFAQLNANLPVIIAPSFKKDTPNITKFGAVPDGNTLNTKPITTAIDACIKKGGGVVENFFIKDIYMKDIPAEAILFDMYYMAKDPVPLLGEKRELPKVEVKPVDETTPVFKYFHISNMYCNGSAKGIFVRGLPEMHVKDIVVENMVLQAHKGIDIQEASSISFKNIHIISADTKPVIDILNSDYLSFDKITYKDGSECSFVLVATGIKTSA